MKREFRLIGAWIIGIAFFLACFPAYTAAASSMEAGSYSADYVVLRAEDDSASIANDYWEKPASITVAKDGTTVRMTINHSKWVTEFRVPSAGGSYAAVKVVSSDDAADKRTVEFRADDLSKPISAKIHVMIEDIGYDHKYTIRFSFDTNSFKLIKAAEKPAEPSKETPVAEKDTGSSSPSDEVSKPTPTSTPIPASTAKPAPQEEKGTNTAAASAGSGGSKGSSEDPKAAGTAEQKALPGASERPAASESASEPADSASAEVKEPMASEPAEPASSNDSASDEAAITDAGNEEAAAIAAIAPIAKEALHPADDNGSNRKGIYILLAVIIAGAVMVFIQKRKRSTRN